MTITKYPYGGFEGERDQYESLNDGGQGYESFRERRESE